MAMISGGDESARNAFRAILRDDSSQLSIISTEEMSAGDVLEVKNLADAIERAERALRESSRPRDMFAELGTPLPCPVPTDDASGPALYAKPILTPIPPPLAAPAKPTLLPPVATPKPPVTATQPLPILMLPNEEDAFLQPAGRMRHFAEETLDGVRIDATAQLRIGARRRSFTLIVGAIVGVLAIAIGAGVIAACMPAKAETKTPATPAIVEAPKATQPSAPAKQSDVPTMNVNDLPVAR
jgi:hypothetical protein